MTHPSREAEYSQVEVLVPFRVQGRLAGVRAVALARALDAHFGKGVGQPEQVLLGEILGAQNCEKRRQNMYHTAQWPFARSLRRGRESICVPVNQLDCLPHATLGGMKEVYFQHKGRK